jgi:large subunit ribosomal protein L21
MYAIVEDSGTQIKVTPGDVVEIDLRDGAEPGSTITFERVLAIGGEGGATIIGAPYVAKATVSAEVLGEFKDTKLHIWKYTRRKGYRKHQGHRQQLLRVRIGDVKRG